MKNHCFKVSLSTNSNAHEAWLRTQMSKASRVGFSREPTLWRAGTSSTWKEATLRWKVVLTDGGRRNEVFLVIAAFPEVMKFDC